MINIRKYRKAFIAAAAAVVAGLRSSECRVGMERNRSLERELLERAKAPHGFIDQVLARLDYVEATEGNTGWERPVDELLAEMGEEAADIAGWAIGAAPQLNETQRQRLVIAIRLGVEAWREVEELREHLSDLRA